MPLTRRSLATAGEIYPLPFVGSAEYTHAIAVDLSGLTADEVDADGYLKPGVPLNPDGALVGVAPDFVFGVTAEPLKVADGNDALSGVMDIAVVTIGQVNRAAAEDIIGRAYTAEEVAGFTAAGSKMVLLE